MDSTAMVLPTSQDVNRQTDIASTRREHPLPTVQSEQESSIGDKTQIDGLSQSEFHNQLRSSYSTPGETVLRNNIEHIGENSKLLLANNLSIPFVHL